MPPIVVTSIGRRRECSRQPVSRECARRLTFDKLTQRASVLNARIRLLTGILLTRPWANPSVS